MAIRLFEESQDLALVEKVTGYSAEQLSLLLNLSKDK